MDNKARNDYVTDADRASENLIRKILLDACPDDGFYGEEGGVTFSGGEPLLRDDFSEIYEELSKLGCIISINSNGYLVNDKIKELFKKYPPNRINVSIYGSDDDATPVSDAKIVKKNAAFNTLRILLLRFCLRCR